MTGTIDKARRITGWWLDRTGALLPPWLLRSGPVPLVRRLTPAGLQPAGKGPWHLLLQDVRPLTLYQDLPAAARPHLRRLVGLQLGHWTPLTAETALFDARVDGTGANGALHVRIDLLPRSRIAPALAAAEAAGLPPPLAVRLDDATLPLGDPPARRLPPRLLLLFLLLLVPPLVAAILQESHLSSLRTEVAAGAMEADQARALGQRVARLRRDTLAAVTARRTAPSQLLLLERLSRVLPTDSHLTELRVEGGRVHLLGYTGDGTALPSLLDADPMVEDVRIEAPVLRAGPQGDRFHLSFRVSTDAPA